MNGLPGSFGEVSPDAPFERQKDSPVSSGFWRQRAKIGRKKQLKNSQKAVFLIPFNRLTGNKF